jgi:nucleotide-binding universal stress UspA family protein
VASSVAPGVDVDTAAVEGEAAEALLDLAEARPGSLLAVGSQGMTGSRRFLLGAVPNKVSHHAPGDVLVGNKGMTGGGRFLLGGVPNKVSHHVETDLLIVKTDRD